MNKKETEQKIDELLERGVEATYPDRKTIKDFLMKKKRIKLYCGFDPSAPSLHIGNAVLINKLAQFQSAGHEVIFLIGDFTGMIGDPTDKSAARKKLTRKEVLDNAKNYVKQASAYLKFNGENPAKVKYNSEWSDKISFKDLIEITSNFTVQQLIQRDMFQKRIQDKKPIYLHEFLYPVAQGYDSVEMEVDLEVGGNDQMFNMMAGRDLMKAMKGKEKFVLTMKLLADDTGKKMGKSEGNAVFLNEDPKNMFGIIMTWPDGVIGAAFELCTKVPMEKVSEIKEKLKDGKSNPRDFKMELAYEITKIVHGEKEAQKAKEYFVNTFSKRETPEDVLAVPSKVPEVALIDYMVEAKMANSKSDARRKVEQGGVEVDGKKVEDWKVILSSDLHDGKILKVGKFKHVRIEF